MDVEKENNARVKPHLLQFSGITHSRRKKDTKKEIAPFNTIAASSEEEKPKESGLLKNTPRL